MFKNQQILLLDFSDIVQIIHVERDYSHYHTFKISGPYRVYNISGYANLHLKKKIVS